MRNREHYLDYAHIAKWGKLNTWTRDEIEAQQRIAYNLDLPYDTVEVVQGKAMRYVDLEKSVRKLFMGV
jgi:hypothetical protein